MNTFVAFFQFFHFFHQTMGILKLNRSSTMIWMWALFFAPLKVWWSMEKWWTVTKLIVWMSTGITCAHAHRSIALANFDRVQLAIAANLKFQSLMSALETTVLEQNVKNQFAMVDWWRRAFDIIIHTVDWARCCHTFGAYRIRIIYFLTAAISKYVYFNMCQTFYFGWSLNHR